VFHPRHKQWNETLLTSKTLQTINDICRMLFALLFVLLRVIYFPYVVFSGVFPDCLEGAKERPEFAPTIYFLLGFAVLFTFLQEYWGYLVVRQVIKAMKGGKKVADKKK
jgi:sterol desaturase/sphingolipid hydroxylase (fatty acid hydroxylase superfamily)